MTTKEWLLRELRNDVAAAVDATSIQDSPSYKLEPWAMRLHMLRRSIALIAECPDEPMEPQTYGAKP